MNLVSSLQNAFHVAAIDAQLCRKGSPPGWHLYTHYRGIVESRTKSNASLGRLRTKANGRRLSLQLTAQHLGAMHGIFVDEDYRLQPGTGEVDTRRVLDLGANVRMAACYFSCFYPDAELICIEPFGFELRRHGQGRKPVYLVSRK